MCKSKKIPTTPACAHTHLAIALALVPLHCTTPFKVELAEIDWPGCGGVWALLPPETPTCSVHSPLRMASAPCVLISLLNYFYKSPLAAAAAVGSGGGLHTAVYGAPRALVPASMVD